MHGNLVAEAVARRRAEPGDLRAAWAHDSAVGYIRICRDESAAFSHTYRPMNAANVGERCFLLATLIV